MTARSALRLRAVLSWGALAGAVVAAMVLLAAGSPGGEFSTVWTVALVVCVLVAVSAAIDLVVIVRRRRRARS